MIIYMKNNLLKLCCLIALASCHSDVFSQVSISGPVCVIPETTYLYTIQGNWDSVSKMKVCLTGGTIKDSASKTSCSHYGKPISTVLVVWDSGTAGAIVVNSSKGRSTLKVIITSKLSAGLIDEHARSQSLHHDKVPLTITCSAAKGGSCNPAYRYQWQQSLNAVSWSDIPEAAGLHLDFSAMPDQTTFYRRKVTETNSGTIGYSDIAVVDLQIAF